jgi:pyruvate dehydrogenase E2 component (dihydrolipoamide acetyltransferase)
MSIDVRMPKLSDNMEEGVIIRWMKSPGDQVVKGEPLAEVETDKADVELEASESGTLREIRVAEGQSAAVGAVIAVLAGPDEQADGNRRAGAKKDAAAPQKEDAAATEDRTAESAADDGDGGAAARAPTGSATREKQSRRETPPAQPQPAKRGRPPETAPAQPAAEAKRSPQVRASPLAWRLAGEAGVNLAGVRGSGPGGRIVQRDVESAVRAPTAAAHSRPASGAAGKKPAADAVSADAAEPGEEAADAPSPPTKGARAPSAGLQPVSRMRATIARRMAEAKREIPHFYVSAEIDMTEAMHLRESIKRREAMPGLTVTHLLLRTLAIALVRHPHVNASWREGGIELHEDVNLGIAVAVDDGLVVPVLHRAQSLTLGEIAARATALTEKARQGRFGGDDLSGGTFSLSNIGMLDVEELVAVINPPQAAILAVGAVKDRPIVRHGQLAVAKTLRATLSCDHRVLNGVEGGRFLEELKGILENPVTLLLE